MRSYRAPSMVRTIVAVVSLTLCAATPALAQRRAPGRAPGRAEPGRAEAGRAEPQRRAVLEQQFRQRGEEIVRRQLNLSDDQMRRLRDVNSHFDGQRRGLVQQERDARTALRNEIARGSSADQGRVAQLMGQVRDLQQQRFALQQQELQQLSGFLTPVQQAQYEGLVTQMRERARQLRAQQNGGDSATP